jgi:GTP-binding protein Era
VGKSTLVNALVGEKVAIVSDKPQTTRTSIRGILTLPEAQVIFIDTPGVHKPRHKLGAGMVRAATATFREVDVICFLVEGHRKPGTGDRYIAAMLREAPAPVVLVLNKMDLLAPGRAGEREAAYREMVQPAATVTVSALRNRGLAELLAAVLKLLPEGPQYYPPEMVTDQPERVIAAEIIREKITVLTREEIPFSIAVSIEEMAEREGTDLVDIRAEVYVERKSQAGIVIGQGGALLKEAGTAARRELEGLLGRRVFLNLWVKVKKDWRNRDRDLHELGYRF